MIHIGKKIEEVVRLKRFPIVEFARKINTTRNNVYNIFSRDSIDTELLRKISTILEVDFFRLLSDSYETAYSTETTLKIAQEHPAVYSISGAKTATSLNELIVLLQKENEQLKEHLSDKEKIISLMKKGELCK